MLPKGTMNYTLSREQFEKYRGVLSTKGIDLVGDSGYFDTHGFRGTFSYAEPTLTVTVTHEPFFFTADEFYAKLTGFFQS